MQAIDFKIDKVVGALVTHEHGDHAKSIRQALEKGIKVLCTKGTYEKAYGEKSYFYKPVSYRQEHKVGNFYITPFRTHHDAAEPCGYLVRHKEIGTLLFATDTYYLEYTFPNINHWLIECNYSKEILDTNVDEDRIHPRLADRLIASHFEFNRVKDMFLANDLSRTRNIILLHLSDSNSNANQYEREIHDLTGVNTYVAEIGLEINLSSLPF